MSRNLLVRSSIIAVLAITFIQFAGCSDQLINKGSWEQKLDHKLPLMGHRNWIVVTDSAYPLQSRNGITTILSDQDMLTTVQKVLVSINDASHVRGKVYLDKEIDYVSKKYAKGIVEYRNELNEALKGANVAKIPHERLIEMLDEAAKTFNILIIKTDLSLAYTSVFFELDCGYWSSQAEADLRKSLEGK